LWHSYRIAGTPQDIKGIDLIGVATNVIIAASFFETTTRRHAIIQEDKQIGACTNYQHKVTGDSKVSSTTAPTTLKS
jgi:hypothetical protein